MSSVYVAKALASKYEFAGRTWYYDFRELNNQFDEDNCKKLAENLLNRYSKLTKDWDAEKNSEWLCRTYLSAKMIMTATLQLNAIEYSSEKNLRLVVPYLAYYSLLSLIRAVVYTLPEVPWDNGKLVSISHHKAINLAFDYISHLDRDISEKLKSFCIKVKAFRELISYRSPSSGDENIGSIDEIENVATILCEVAQFNSELLESSILKNAGQETFVFENKFILDLSECEIEGELFFDREDACRLDYLRRKYPVSPNILHTMTEGHVEDFFGAWVSKEDDDEVFDPDNNWQLIFDIP
ncbi:MAG: hypothetical protein Q8S94_00455 [Pseudohongiella sp.]|nr:hypothetical protein [Pseudohongiella sp.]